MNDCSLRLIAADAAGLAHEIVGELRLVCRERQVGELLALDPPFVEIGDDGRIARRRQDQLRGLIELVGLAQRLHFVEDEAPVGALAARGGGLQLRLRAMRLQEHGKPRLRLLLLGVREQGNDALGDLGALLAVCLIAHIVDEQTVEAPLVVLLRQERAEAGQEARLERGGKVVFAPGFGGERLRLVLVAVRQLDGGEQRDARAAQRLAVLEVGGDQVGAAAFDRTAPLPSAAAGSRGSASRGWRRGRPGSRAPRLRPGAAGTRRSACGRCGSLTSFANSAALSGLFAASASMAPLIFGASSAGRSYLLRGAMRLSRRSMWAASRAFGVMGGDGGNGGAAGGATEFDRAGLGRWGCGRGLRRFGRALLPRSDVGDGYGSAPAGAHSAARMTVARSRDASPRPREGRVTVGQPMGHRCVCGWANEHPSTRAIGSRLARCRSRS